MTRKVPQSLEGQHMTRTAYSTQFGGEFDVEQLVRLCTGRTSDARFDLNSELTHEAVSAIVLALECPSCSATGPTVIREGRSRNGRAVDQAHFRFIGRGGQTAHHPLCDFYRSDSPNAKREGGVNFGETKSALTRAIGQLVCVGIERKMFGQPDMRALRRWHFELRIAHQFRITLPAAAIDWCTQLVGRRGRENDLAFQPSFGDLVDFDWRLAAQREISIRYHPVISRFLALLPFGVGWFNAKERAIALVNQRTGDTVFDAMPLAPFYQRAIALAEFAADHWQPLRQAFSRRSPIGEDPKGAPVLALSALLLFVSDWELPTAAAKLVELIAAPQARDLTLGNFIGLNPFHDVSALGLIKAVQEVTQGVRSSFDYEAEVRAEMQQMQARYSAYRSAGQQTPDFLF